MRPLTLFAFLAVCSFASTDALSHCDLAYVPKGRLQESKVSKAELENRTSVVHAERVLSRRAGIGSNKSYADLTSDQVRAAMPLKETNKRQDNLIYWLLYIRKLYEEKNYEDVISVVQGLRHQRLISGSDAKYQADEGDVSAEGHFSISNITRLILAYEKPSILQIKANEGFGLQYFKALKQTFHTHWMSYKYGSLSPPAASASFSPVIPRSALEPTKEYIRSLSTQKRWVQLASTAKYAGMLGFTNTREFFSDLYFTEGDIVFSVSLGRDGNSFAINEGLTCRDHIDESLLGLSKRWSDPDIVVAALVRAPDRFVLTLAEGGVLRHIFLTSEEFEELAEGRIPPGSDGKFGSHIEEIIRSNRSIVFWSHPLMQKKGPRFRSEVHHRQALFSFGRKPE